MKYYVYICCLSTIYLSLLYAPPKKYSHPKKPTGLTIETSRDFLRAHMAETPVNASIQPQFGIGQFGNVRRDFLNQNMQQERRIILPPPPAPHPMVYILRIITFNIYH